MKTDHEDHYIFLMKNGEVLYHPNRPALPFYEAEKTIKIHMTEEEIQKYWPQAQRFSYGYPKESHPLTA